MSRRKRLPTYFRPAEAEALLDAAANEREHLIILTGLSCGVRVSELTGLEVTDVDLDRASLLVRHGKGDKDRAVPIPDVLLGGLRNWIGERRVGYLFPSPRTGRRYSSRAIQLMVKRLARKANLPGWEVPRKCTPHKMRHSYATTLLNEAGATIRDVQQLLGHASVSVTEIYTHTNPQRFKWLVDKLGFGTKANPPAESEPPPADEAPPAPVVESTVAPTPTENPA